MKKVFATLAVLVLFGIGCTEKPINQDDLFIDRILWHEKTDQLFFVGKINETSHGVFSKNKVGKITQHLKIDHEFWSGHLFSTKDGVIYYSSNGPAKLWRSEDSGITWEIVLEDVDMFWDIVKIDDSTLLGTLWSENHPAIWRSDNRGKTWFEWKNLIDQFPEWNKTYDENSDRNLLRHLHSIDFSNRHLFVGTGDKARHTLLSKNNGDAWEKIWDEGYTASIVEENAIYLGADGGQLGKGIARYDFDTKKITEIWMPKDEEWEIANIFSMLKKGGSYFAAVHIEDNNLGEEREYGILFSEDGDDWKLIKKYSSKNLFTRLYLADSWSNDFIFVSHEGGLEKLELSK